MSQPGEDEELPGEEQEDRELYEHYRFTIDKGQDPLRVDKFLVNRIENATRTKIQSAAEAGCIHANGKPVKSNYRIKPGDLITVMLPNPPREIELIPQDLPLNILFEDEDIIIINKEAGMVVHPGYGNYTGTLMNALVHHFRNLPVSKTQKIEADLRPGLVHRIDKNTSGVIVIAKNELSMTRMAKKFFDRDIDRSYVALVWGDLKEDQGTITGNIGRSLKDRKKMAVFPNGDHGKHAVTHWKVLERFGYVTLVECKLETGRTHQIRVHMEYAGHPLFNDDRYGGDRILKGTTFSKYKQFVQNCFELLPRHALHARSLGFRHPSTGKYIHFESELPADMKAVLEKWRSYAVNRKLMEED
jgi:23S rRNA pseudouridine1911/1915/1917 synthase